MKQRFLNNWALIKEVYNKNSGPIIKAIYNRHKAIYEAYFFSPVTTHP